ncbi:putative ribonuclease H-like domain-containing protein [Tanacetum coccineum]
MGPKLLELGIKCTKAFPLLVVWFPLLKHFPTVSVSLPLPRFPLLEDFPLLNEDKDYSELKTQVIEFGDSYKAPPKETPRDKAAAGEVFTKKKGRTVAITTEDMQKRRNDVKERTTLLLALPDKHQLRFSKYDNAKELWEAILKTFGGNEATKKTKNNQLKQQYGNFKAEGSETLEQTFNRLQAIVCHLEFMDVPIEKDYLNQKFLTSLAPEWLMYTIVWRNRDDLDIISLDDLYNHLKSINQRSKRRQDQTHRIWPLFLHQTQAVKKVKFPLLKEFSLLVFKPNGSQIKYEDITQIDDDDIEEMDIKWNLALLSTRADRWNASIATKWVILLESAKHQEVKTEEREKATRRILSYMVEEDKASNYALVADEEEIPTEIALMAMSSSSSDDEVYDDSYCSKSYRKNTENLNTKISKLNEELSDCETNLFNYKRGLSQVEARLVEFKNNEIKFCERIRVLERDVEIRDNKIESLRSELEGLKKEKESIDHKLARFENASKGLKDLLGNQRSVKDKTSLPEFIDDTDNIDDKGYWDSGCSRHMTENISYISEYEPYDGGYVSFGHGGGNITGKGTIKIVLFTDSECLVLGKDFKIDDSYVLLRTPRQHNMYSIDLNNIVPHKIFSVSQICDNKNSVLFTDSECLVLGKDFKLIDDTHVFLRTPRHQNMYSIDLKNVIPHKNLTCLIAKASVDESMMWHRRLGHLNFKTMNKLVRNNLVKGLPSKSFKNDHTCVACLKGKQHKASCKSKLTFFLKSKDETSSILRNFITGIENLKDLKVKIIRCDNGGEFRVRETDEFCSVKAEAVSTACYVQNKVLVNKSQNKTPYELFNGRAPAIGFLRLFRCHVMILNTLDHLGKFDAKGDEGYFVGYSLSSKAFRVFNKRTKKVDENLHVDFLVNKPIEKRVGPNWLFDIDTLTHSMNYVPVVVAGTSFTNISCTKEDANQTVKENASSLRFIALPIGS